MERVRVGLMFILAGFVSACATDVTPESNTAIGQNPGLDESIRNNRVFDRFEGPAGILATGGTTPAGTTVGTSTIGSPTTGDPTSGGVTGGEGIGVRGTTLCQGSTMVLTTDAMVCGTVESRMQSESCPAGYAESATGVATGGTTPGGDANTILMFSCDRELANPRTVIPYATLPTLSPCAEGAPAIRATGVRTAVSDASVLLFTYELLCSCAPERIWTRGSSPDASNPNVTTGIGEATCGVSASSLGRATSCPGGVAPRCNTDGSGCVC